MFTVEESVEHLLPESTDLGTWMVCDKFGRINETLMAFLLIATKVR